MPYSYVSCHGLHLDGALERLLLHSATKALIAAVDVHCNILEKERRSIRVA